MLDGLKRMLIRDRARAHWRDIETWSVDQDFHFRRARDDTGFVIDVKVGQRAARLEWGPSQRDYIVGPELRLRTELGLPQNLQLLVLSRPLMHELERATFERFTDSLQTHIDTSTPEEMRWLAMFPKFSFGAGRTSLAARIGAVGSSRTALTRWIEGELSAEIEKSGKTVLAFPTPFVLMTLRGRVMLRLGLPIPRVDAITQALALFGVAVERAAQIADLPVGAPSVWPSTAAGALQTPDVAEEEPKRRR
jgi:hypothetical protein